MSSNPSIDKLIPVEQLSFLYKQSLIALFATLAVLLYVYLWLQDLEDQTSVLLWVSSIIFCNIYLAIWLYFVHRGHSTTGINTQKANNLISIYQIQAVLHGTAWGLLPFILTEQNSPDMGFFAYLILGGMAAGAISTTAVIFRLYLSYTLPLTVPIIFTQLFFYEQLTIFNPNTLELYIVFIISLIVLAHSYYKSSLRSISLLIKNKQLLSDITSAYEETKVASKAKSDFLANMSHELRTPLTAIIGYSEIINEDVSAKQYDSLSGDIKKVIKSGEHLLSLINNILDLSKIESGKMDIYIENINIEALLQELKSTTGSIIKNNNNNLNISFRSDTTNIKSDSTKLYQVLLNIISNAAKFTTDGEINIKVTSNLENIKMIISDTGIGMNKEQLSKLTQPFMQGDISTTKKYGGTGLGMNLTKNLTDILKIKLSVSSFPNKGTSFELIIPIDYPSLQNKKKEPS